MNKRKLLIATILSIFLCGMLLASVGAAHAKTVTIKTKLDKKNTKKVGKYKIQALNWKTPTFQEVDVFAYKNGDYLKLNKYKVKIYYKIKGKTKITKWKKGDAEFGTYFKYLVPLKAKVTKVKVKF